MPADNSDAGRRAPAAFGASVARARAATRDEGRGVSRTNWAAGLVLLGLLLAAGCIVALLAFPDLLTPARAARPTPAALVALAAPTLSPAAPTLSPATPIQPPATPTFAPPTVTPPASATPAPSIPPTPTAIPTWTPTVTPPPAYPPTRLLIPAIGVDAPVEPVGWSLQQVGDGWEIQWDVPDGAAGWHQTSALPGRAGNTVLSGHHNIEGMVFRDLVTLKAGDEVYLAAGPQIWRYVVTETMILQEKGVSVRQRQENARWIGTFPDERLTLVTCWPADNNTHRVIVVARPQAR